MKKTILIILWVLIAARLIYGWVERNESRRRLEIRTAAAETRIQMLEQELRAAQDEGMTAARYDKEQSLHQDMARIYDSLGQEYSANLQRTLADGARVMSDKMREIAAKYGQ